MKKLMIVFLLFCLLLPPALGEENALYECVALKAFQLRAEPNESARRIKKTEKGTTVIVYEYGSDWCRVQVEGREGWCKREWLWRFRSLSPMTCPVPDQTKTGGVATVQAEFSARTEKYSGNLFPVGAVFVYSSDEDGISFPMMREYQLTGAENVTVRAFVPWQSAQAGDVIAGFTTYYNERTGGSMAGNRAENIALACARLNDTVIASGETFSYNALCAPYTRGNGYLLAPNISNDGVGYGGGVCQLSTTLYNALIILPVQLGPWTVHRTLGVPYARAGFDCAVGSYSDLTFENLLPYPLRIKVLDQQGILTVLLERAE